jgi:hypothetical protein
LGEVAGFGIDDQAMINQRELVADAFKALPYRYLLHRVELFQSTGFDRLDQIGDGVIQSLHGHLQRCAFSAVAQVVPEFHAIYSIRMCVRTQVDFVIGERK